MNNEKQNGVFKPRPASSASTQSPRLAARGTSLPRVADPHATHVYASPRPRFSHAERPALQNLQREEAVATPVKPFLSTNITPRSGARKARAENASPSPSNTPIGTPGNSRPSSSKERLEAYTEDAHSANGLGLRIAIGVNRSRTGSLISDGPGSSVSSKPSRPVLQARNNSATSVSSPEGHTKFFYANEARSLPPLAASGTPLQGRLSGHTQLNEENVKALNDGTSLPVNGLSPQVQSPKFFYANESTESRTLANSAGGATPNRPPLQTIYSAQTASSPPRAPSPLKEELIARKPSVSKASPRRHTRLISNGGTEIKPPEAILQHGKDILRRSSLNSRRQTPTPNRVRSSSVTSAGPIHSQRSSIAVSTTSPIERTTTNSAVEANRAQSHSVNPSVAAQEDPQSPLPSLPQSPTKKGAGQSTIDHMNELAANARRERKVLDLEISNSSLLAINRTLEREMRKQNAELRRYRRMSRSGRVSIAPSRSASGKMPIMSETETNIDSDDLLSASDEEDVDDLTSNLSSTSNKLGPLSPESRASQSRFQDPARIELDLAAHKALLLDSQKLNTSIKRCLMQSEDLLSSGKKALEHHARREEPESLAPRVLTPDDVDDDNLEHGRGLLSPSISAGGHNPWEKSLGNLGSLEGGLSTPDYSNWGPPTYSRGSSLDEIVQSLEDFPDASVKKEASGTEVESADSVTDVNTNSTPMPPLSPPKDLAPEPEMLMPKPQLPDRRVSDISLDGIDSSSSDDSDASDDEKTLQSFTERARTPEGRSMIERKQTPKPPDPNPGEAGYRGSMQGLGHYLQAFSLFGTKQEV
ncbi:hypothetical protein MMC21_006898 [Puttea exsequens]|nr:hypothetical protein [Puttea exsequens]